MFGQLRSPIEAWPRLMTFGVTLMFIVTSCGDDPVSQPTTGTILVSATTAGVDADLDPNGYTVALSNGYRSPIAIVGTVYVEDLEAGDYEVGLTGMEPNCTATGENPLSVTVVPADTVDAEFDIICETSDPPGNGGDVPLP